MGSVLVVGQSILSYLHANGSALDVSAFTSGSANEAVMEGVDAGCIDYSFYFRSVEAFNDIGSNGTQRSK